MTKMHQGNLLIDFYTHRNAIGYLGFVLIAGVILFDKIIPLSSSDPDFVRGSISAYYHSAGGVLFAGVLSVIGLALIAYKGFEGDWKYTFSAGVCALGIALFPTKPDNAIFAENFGLPTSQITSIIHGSFAVTFFVLIWIIMRYRFTLSNKPKNNKKYRLLSSVMMFATLIALFFSLIPLLFIETKAVIESWKLVFWVEVVGIVCFSLAWLTKGRAILPLIGSLYTDESSTK